MFPEVLEGEEGATEGLPDFVQAEIDGLRGINERAIEVEDHSPDLFLHIPADIVKVAVKVTGNILLDTGFVQGILGKHKIRLPGSAPVGKPIPNIDNAVILFAITLEGFLLAASVTDDLQIDAPSVQKA